VDYQKYHIKCGESVFLISLPLNNDVASGIDLEITHRANMVLKERLSFCSEAPQ